MCGALGLSTLHIQSWDFCSVVMGFLETEIDSTQQHTLALTGSAVAAASDIHRQMPTHMADIRRDWLTNQNTD